MAYGTIKVDTIENTNGLTGNAIGPGFKNRIINGAMVIDQRNAGASFTPTDQTYSLDRWKCRVSQASKYTVQQNAGSVTPPAGFTNYLGVTSSSAYSITSSDYFTVQQLIEGFNLADLAWGTASAKAITISFWVRSSLTGTFGGALMNSAENRSYPFTYSISSANTWEQKTVNIAGDTSGTWVTNNGIGLYVAFGLGVGSTYSGTAGAWAASSTILSATGATSVVGTNGATFYITGVQLEVGPSATSFDYRPYGTELALCQRYFEKSMPIGTAPTGSNTAGLPVVTAFSTSLAGGWIPHKVTMRAAPTLTIYRSNGTSGAAEVFTNGALVTGTITAPEPSESGFRYINNGSSGFTSGVGYQFGYTASAEL